MKALKLFHSGLIGVLLLLSSCAVSQVRNQKQAEVKALLESRNFLFVAESASPMGGGNIRLTSAYNLSIRGDSLNSHLPYFGTAYRAPFGSSTSPLSFTSSDFDYDSKTSGNGSYTITIRLNKPADPDVMTLSVSRSGYGTLHVNSIDRQPISFYGYIDSL